MDFSIFTGPGDITIRVWFSLTLSPQPGSMASAITHLPYKLLGFSYPCGLDILQRQRHAGRTQAWLLSRSTKRARCTTWQQASVPITLQCCSCLPPATNGHLTISICWLFEQCHSGQVCSHADRQSSFVGRKAQGGGLRVLCQL